MHVSALFLKNSGLSYRKPIMSEESKIDFEDISSEVYPDRNLDGKHVPPSPESFESWSKNFVKLRCQSKISSAIESS